MHDSKGTGTVCVVWGSCACVLVLLFQLDTSKMHGMHAWPTCVAFCAQPGLLFITLLFRGAMLRRLKSASMSNTLGHSICTQLLVKLKLLMKLMHQ